MWASLLDIILGSTAPMQGIFLIALCASICTSLVSSVLFINNKPIIARKVHKFQNLYKHSLEVQAGSSGTFEERLSTTLQTHPLAAVKFSVSTLIAVGVCAEWLFPQKAQLLNDVRIQCGLAALAVKVADIYECFQIADFSQRDQLFTKDVLNEAKAEISKLVGSPLGLSTAYLAITLLTQCRRGSFIPFTIGEIPSILRFAVLVAITAAPENVLVRRIIVDWLQGTGTGTGTATRDDSKPAAEQLAPLPLQLDALCDRAAGIAEVIVVSKSAMSLLLGGESSSVPVRSLRDILLLIARVLLIQNFLYLRVRDLTSNADIFTWFGMVKSLPVMEQLKSLPGWSKDVLVQVRSLLTQSLNPSDLTTSLRSLYHKGSEMITNKKRPRLRKNKRNIHVVHAAHSAPTHHNNNDDDANDNNSQGGGDDKDKRTGTGIATEVCDAKEEEVTLVTEKVAPLSSTGRQRPVVPKRTNSKTKAGTSTEGTTARPGSKKRAKNYKTVL